MSTAQSPLPSRRLVLVLDLAASLLRSRVLTPLRGVCKKGIAIPGPAAPPGSSQCHFVGPAASCSLIVQKLYPLVITAASSYFLCRPDPCITPRALGSLCLLSFLLTSNRFALVGDQGKHTS